MMLLLPAKLRRTPKNILFLFCLWICLMFSMRLVSAFVPRIARTAGNHVLHRRIVRQATGFRNASIVRLEAAKSAKYARQASLVVHGPSDFSKSKSASGRPFKLVIVESPSKCKTISKILQQYVQDQNLDHDYVVTSCMGHIRNLPQKKAHKEQTIAGIDLDQGYKPSYVILAGKEQLVGDLKDLSYEAQQLILATDDDREGEAMAWHLLQVLGGKKNSEQFPPLRVRFTEITPKAIVNSIEKPEKSLRDSLVQAQETRRVLDRLAGFTVSPILWKKIAPGLSAGRVQSAGMALIVKRERERLLFQETEYWDLQGNFSAFSDSFQGQLMAVDGTILASGGSDFEAREVNKLKESSSHKLHLKSKDAKKLVQRLAEEQWTWQVANVTATQRKLNPPSPFITSTLQQEANKRLALSVSRTMQAAQKLYENGFISYMRTDSNHLSDDAKQAIKAVITRDFGGADFYQPTTAGSKKKKEPKAPEAQAAHEAIRPAIQTNGAFASPSDLPSNFEGVEKELYRLIYQRTVASHLPPQVSNQTSIRILGTNGDSTVLFRTSGSVVIKPGYTAVYPKQADKISRALPSLQEGQTIICDGVDALKHTTQPPARYTEASFVQELETLGVGRPSTYAGIVQILRDRAYVGSPATNDSSRRGPGKVVSGPAISAQRAAGGEEFTGARNARGPMVPSLTAFVVCSLLEKHCNMYVDPSFTARMEERLDKIANSEENVSEEERIAYLNEFYAGDRGLASQIKRIEEAVDAEEARRADLPALKSEPSTDTEIGLFVGPWGPYVKKVAVSGEDGGKNDTEKAVTAQLPAGMASDLSIITIQSLNGVLATKEENGSILGQHPDDGRNIRLKVGRFGAYLQCGEDGEDGTTTHTLPRSIRNMKTINTDASTSEENSLNGMLGISLEEAVQYVNLPRTVCTMDELPIIAAIGPYGPYLKYNNTFMNLKPSDGDVISIDSDTAQALVLEGIVNQKSKRGAGILAEVGEKEGSMITVKNGRFGAYINWKRVNAKLPADYHDNPSELPLEEAWSLIKEKAGSMPDKAGKRKKSKNEDQASDLPQGPKRPLSAYLHFCAAKRPEVAATAKSLGSISKELARLWSETSEEDRIPYVSLAESGKSAYEEEKKKWIKECQTILAEKDASQSVKANGVEFSTRGKYGPKRPKSAYLFFSSAKRAEVSEKFNSLGEISKELGRRWAATNESDRREYEAMAAKDKVRYEEEKAKAKEVNSRAKGKSKKQARTKKKRGPSAYMLFCAAHRDDIVDENGKRLPLGETTKRLAALWKKCDDKTRARFVAEAEKQKALL